MRGLGLGLSRRRAPTVAPEPEPEPVWEDEDLRDGWSAVNMSISSAPDVHPENPTLNAASALETVTDASHYIHANIPFTQGVTYRIRVVVKGVGRTVVTILVAETPTKYWYGTIGTTTALLSSGMDTPVVEDLGNGFYAHSINFTLTASSGSKNVRIGVALDPLDTTFPGDVTKGLLLGSVKIYEV